MLRRLAVLVVPALAALASGGAVRAQGGPQCPDNCTATFGVQASGTVMVGDVLTLTPLAVNSGQGAEIGVIGGGTVCTTCEPCSVDFLFSWQIFSDKCLSYNHCGLLQDGPGFGTLPGSLSRECGRARNLLIEYGTCNPAYMGACPPEPVDPVTYTELWTLRCGACQ